MKYLNKYIGIRKSSATKKEPTQNEEYIDIKQMTSQKEEDPDISMKSFED